MRKSTLVAALVAAALTVTISTADARPIKECKYPDYKLGPCGVLVHPIVPHTGQPYTS